MGGDASRGTRKAETPDPLRDVAFHYEVINDGRVGRWRTLGCRSRSFCIIALIIVTEKPLEHGCRAVFRMWGLHTGTAGLGVTSGGLTDFAGDST